MPRSLAFKLSAFTTVSFLTLTAAEAAQTGPFFPSHRYPTDQSYHLGYQFRLLSTSTNYSGGAEMALPNNSNLKIMQHEMSAEFQPNRNLSVGAALNLQNVTVSNGTTGVSASKQSLGDQRIFAEYRFFDAPGKSAGAAIMVKFPGYKNPTSNDITTASPLLVLLGDAQTDFTTLLTSEIWFSRRVRSRLDLGYTYRTEQYAGEIPFQASIAYVTPQYELELRFRGNATMGNDGFDPADTDTPKVQKAFGNSNYAFSANPWILVVEPRLEYWTSPRFAISAEFSLSLRGNNAPKYYGFAGGLTYRWAQTKVREKRTFQEVNIETDQESGQFQGENLEKFEPKAPNPDRMQEEPNRGDDSGDEP